MINKIYYLEAASQNPVGCQGMLQVRHTLTRTPSGLNLTEPKSARSRRHIALSPTAVEALRHHRRQQSEERLKLGSAWNHEDLVFANIVGCPIGLAHLRNERCLL